MTECTLTALAFLFLFLLKSLLELLLFTKKCTAVAAAVTQLSLSHSKHDEIQQFNTHGPSEVKSSTYLNFQSSF